LEFFNGIGYHLANGYGMTEIGITSLELSGRKKVLNSGSIGAPIGHTEYSVAEDGVLLVKGETRAVRILQGKNEEIVDLKQWFRTGDLVRFAQGRYYAAGRSDDLIVGRDGENLNPQIAEGELAVTGIDRLCVFCGESGAPILLVSIPGCFDSNKLSDIYCRLTEQMEHSKLDRAIRSVYFTHESLLLPGEFKISRKKIARRFQEKQIKYFEPTRIKEHIAELGEGLETEILECFATVLDREASTIGPDDHFFLDLHGTSMDYFVLLGTIKSRLGVELSYTDGVRLISVRQIADHIKNQ
jgi:long-subunit acyl-CoA synthetase (AMP-forming)